MRIVGPASMLLQAACALSCERVDTVIAEYHPTISIPSSSPATPDASATPTLRMPDAAVPAPDAPPPDGSGPVPSAPNAIYFEAEDGVLSGPMTVANELTLAGETASGEGYIVSSEAQPSNTEPGAGRAFYDFELGEAGDYVLWGRLYGPSVTENRFWMRLDESAWVLWRLSTGELWHWDDAHDNLDYGSGLVFPLEPGEHRLEIATAAPEARIDRFYITSNGDEPPGNLDPCDPPHSIQLGGSCVRSCGSYGMVSCLAEACIDREELPVYDCAVCCLVE
jgi:hypothetical protein